MLNLFANDHQYNLMPIKEGKSGEDLNQLKITQIRVYSTDINTVKNVPSNTGGWFSVETIMNNDSTGIMFLYAVAGAVFFRQCTGGSWSSWRKI